jgi:hypothetical protein
MKGRNKQVNKKGGLMAEKLGEYKQRRKHTIQEILREIKN